MRTTLQYQAIRALFALMLQFFLIGVTPVRAQSTTSALAQSASAPTTQPSTGPAVPRDLNSILAPIREKHRLPALAGAIVRGDRLVALGAVGVRNVDAREPITTRDRFHIGSCTKAMTATLIAQLVEEGKLQWTTTVGAVFPDLRDKLDPGYRDVTIEQLLAHRGGAPDNLAADGLWGRLWNHTGTPTEQRRALVEGVVCRPPANTPGTTYLYSNAGYAIAGAMAEQVTGMAWETLLQRRLFEPLKMASAGFGAPPGAETNAEPSGHVFRDGLIQPIPPGKGSDNPAAIGPAGTVHCSLADWAKFVSLHLLGAQGKASQLKGGPLLKPESFTKLQTEPPGQAYALGWGVAQRPWGGRVLTHAGSNTMWFAVVWFAPEKNFAVLVATNLGSEPAPKACDEAAAALIHYYLSTRLEP